VEVGSSLLIVGFPLGFHDALHHLPVVRQAIIASSFGLRFQGKGYFLTDARMHRGTSGAPVVQRAPERRGPRSTLPWMLLGVHSAQFDMGTRDSKIDESLGLNCAWYADILMTLTEPPAAPSAIGARR
jgi:S1-C subfamily serine protease